ncbi:LacI family DNA-binding transcriptional regulator [Salinicola aestuarinus]|uniref:LacI family DNA-binding transcriptional regulator n=1 Tax=Salinicola aestuarinus TaxID=1949082 RepID=UPI000DA13AAC|nr:LacI family DNA-binding transcriptional regulator [Salinicola aestuarinus]
MTLKTVAQQLGVSATTVSNAYNRPDQLSETRREEILAAAEALGYTGPDSRGRMLRTGRSGIVALLLADNLSYSLRDSVASELIAGVAEQLDQHDHSLMLLPGRLEEGAGSVDMADGVIVYGLHGDARRILKLLDDRPAVGIDIDLPGVPSVHIDNYRASLALTRHALRRPYRRVAIVGLRLTRAQQGLIDSEALLASELTVTRRRLDGVLQAFIEADIDPHSIALWNIDRNTHDGCVPTIAALLDQPLPARPDLLICLSDRIALTAIDLAERRGLKVPRDLRITGFDGIAEGQRRRPRLTTVRQDSTAKGRLAAAMLLDLGPRRSRTLETELLIGDSAP